MSSPQPKTPPLAQAGRWKHGPVPVIGLIGGIGSGKSRVADLLASRGAVVIDADEVGHDVLNRPDIRRAVAARFGPGVCRPVGPGESGPPPIDRRALGGIVFSDPAALRDLEALVHPPMERQFHDAIARVSRQADAPAVILDAAILLEKGWDRFCDLVAFVDAPWALRLERVSGSRGWSAETLRAREAAQWPVEVKRSRADAIIPNDGGIEALGRSVDAFLDATIRPEPTTRHDRLAPAGRAHPEKTMALPGDRR
ncbi:MAG: dephospho-CoA kinase [Isosphaeraceae bacterium]